MSIIEQPHVHIIGRPAIELTQEKQLRISQALRVGASLADAARYAGISKKTLQRWIKQGQSEESGQCYELWQHIEKARADLVVSLLLKIDHAANKHWKAAAWKLERLCPKLYGKTGTNQDLVDSLAADDDDPDEKIIP